MTPETAAHSLAIGAPGDGYLVIDAVLKRGGTGGFASDPEIFAGIDLLAATEGLLTEPAGGTTIAVLEKLAAAGRFAPDDTVVAIITGNGLKTLDDHPREAVAGEDRLRARRDARRAERAQERRHARARARASSCTPSAAGSDARSTSFVRHGRDVCRSRSLTSRRVAARSAGRSRRPAAASPRASSSPSRN